MLSFLNSLQDIAIHLMLLFFVQDIVAHTVVHLSADVGIAYLFQQMQCHDKSLF